MAQYKTVNIPADDKVKLDALAEKANESIASYLNSAINYFIETGVDPKSRFKSYTDELAITRKELSKQIKESRDTYVSFIRELESKKLSLIANSIDTIAIRLLNYLDNEAPTKEDLSKLKESLTVLSNEPLEKPASKVSIPISETKQELLNIEDPALIKRAKYLFTSFLEAGHKQTLGSGWVFDEKTVAHYKMLFNQL